MFKNSKKLVFKLNFFAHLAKKLKNVQKVAYFFLKKLAKKVKNVQKLPDFSENPCFKLKIFAQWAKKLKNVQKLKMFRN